MKERRKKGIIIAGNLKGLELVSNLGELLNNEKH
jgi:hypothetical protein